jgi:ABC-type amino acid transport substrate-binding protein
MHYLFEVLSEILPNPTARDIYVFCNDHFIIAVVIAYVLLAIIGAVVSSSVIEITRELAEVRNSRRAKLSAAVLAVTGVALSLAVVTLMLRRLEPVPIFNVGPRNFIREPVVLSWSFASPDPDMRSVYEIESSVNRNFAGSSRTISDNNSLYSYQAEGARWWRVRAKIGGTSGNIKWSGPSAPVKTTFFQNSFSQIKNNGELLVYVSNSLTQGIFRFLGKNGALRGADVSISGKIAAALAAEIGKPVIPHFVPVPWTTLLNRPNAGDADIIISSISTRQARESQYQIAFSRPYFCSGQSIIYRKSDWPTDVRPREMLRNKTVGYELNSTSQELVEKLAGEVGGIRKQPSGELEQLIQSLLAPNSTVQLIVTDTPFARERLLRGDAANLASKPFSEADYPTAATAEERQDEYAIAVAQGETQLLNIVNKTITEMKHDGTLTGILTSATDAIHPGIAAREKSELTTSLCPD